MRVIRLKGKNEEEDCFSHRVFSVTAVFVFWTELSHKILTGIKLDKTAPSVGIPSRIPEGDVQPGQEVKISVNATDPLSNIKNVTLSYNLNNGNVWVNLPMTYNSTTGLYETAIQIQQANTLVKYKIIACDNAGNHKVEDNNGQFYVYTVIPEFPSIIVVLLLFMIISTATLIGKIRKKTSPI